MIQKYSDFEVPRGNRESWLKLEGNVNKRLMFEIIVTDEI